MVKKLNFTTIHHDVRLSLELSMNDYAVANLIYNLSNDPSGSGWCYASKETIGEYFGLSKQSVHTIILKLQSSELIEKHPDTKHLKTTQKWFDNVISTSKETLPLVKEVYSNSKESLLGDSKESLHNNNINNKDNNNTLTIVKGEKPQYGNSDINLCMEELTQLLGNRPTKETLNRYAIKRLITKLGTVSRVIGAINYAFKIREEDRYAPRIYNFIDLEEKLEPLKGYGKQKTKSKSVNVEDGIAYLEGKKTSVIVN